MRPGARDAQFERDFLDGAERIARSVGSGFAEEVADRLTRAERAYGVDSYLDKGMLGLLSELDEEALDVGGWGVLAALVANAEIEDADDRVLIVSLLQQLAALGVHAHQIILQIERVLKD